MLERIGELANVNTRQFGFMPGRRLLVGVEYTGNIEIRRKVGYVFCEH